MSLIALIYLSSLSAPGVEVLEEIAAGARSKNARLQVTGCLLHYDHSILQYLEGPEAAVRALFASIEADPRHRQVTKMLDHPVASRRFASWSMVCLEVAGDEWKRILPDSNQCGGGADPDAAGALIQGFCKAAYRRLRP